MRTQHFKFAIVVLSFMSLSACQAKEGSSVNPHVEQAPSVPPTVSKIQDCPHKLTKQMTWQEIAQTAHEIQKSCTLTHEEFAELLKEQL